MKTEKLYDNDSELFEFSGTVVSCEALESGDTAVVLDKTAFFPEAGGQSADSGVLGGFSVKDVRIYDDGRIVHILDSAENAQKNAAAFSPGDVVNGHIDSERRLEFMRHHTAEHMFSGLVHRDFGYANVGFHLSDHICTMDYNGPISEEDVARLEEETNRLIQKNLPVRAWYPEEDKLAHYDYRCKGELVPPIRLVEVEGVDLCACCAPHVKLTGETGLMKVLDASTYKGGMRITIVCGMKAFKELSRRSEILLKASASLSSHFDELGNNIEKLKSERLALSRRCGELALELLSFKADAVPNDSADALLFVEEAPDKAARDIINDQMKRRDGFCGIFTGSDEAGYRFILGSKGKDMQLAAKRLREELRAKCGGSSDMISGKTDARKDEILKAIKRGGA